MTCVEGPLISDCPIPFITCWSKSNYGNPISRWGTVAVGYSLQWKRREIPRHAGLELENGSGFSRKGQRHWLSSSPREKLQRQVRSRQPGTPSPPVLKSKRMSTPRPSGEGLACHVPGARQSGPPSPHLPGRVGLWAARVRGREERFQKTLPACLCKLKRRGSL